MDDARRRFLLAGSGLGQTILREEDRDPQVQADLARARHAVYQRHPLSGGRREHFLQSSPLGRVVLRHEEQLRSSAS